MHDKGVKDEFDIMIGGMAWSIDEEFGSDAYILATYHASTTMTMLNNAMLKKDIIFPSVWRMRVKVTPEGYTGSYTFRDWSEYQPQYFFEFKRIDDLAKTYFPDRQ